MMDEYEQLDRRVQKWVFKQGWSDLREIQKRAIKPILSGDRDVLISASTAAGKTEAFFLPACSAIADLEQGFGILYISPLKALINDQYRRLESLCELLDMPVTPWHGDISQGKKNKVKKFPLGILLITPESLESLFVRESGWVKKAFCNLKYIVIDEFHAFIGSERGQHLLSLLNRLEHLLDRYTAPIPRVALSATLGELEKVPLLLRPNGSIPCETITNTRSHSTFKVQVRGYVETVNIGADNSDYTSAEYRICEDIYKLCRGDSNLVFANSRKRTESVAAQLSDFCGKNIVPNEFFPHHGSLSKELREELELRLQKETLPTTAICTMTLELGIDIGKVNSIIQVTAPHSVSSLRQRMGRSGRRNSPAILRMLITENELSNNSHIIDKLRIELIQSLAMIRLLVVSKWFEPADTSQSHFSTLLHQVLATTAQWGGIRADQLYVLLCKNGTFQKVSIQHFKHLLSHMGTLELLTQLSSGELVLGIKGERIVNHYTFYAVFKTPEEYRILAGSRTLGTVPIDSIILEGMHIIFGGRRWKATNVDTEKKVINVEAAQGGRPPEFGGSGMFIHDVVRQEMLKIYTEEDYRIAIEGNKIDFADKNANSLFTEGTSFFRSSNLTSQSIIQEGQRVYIFTWMGDKIVNTIVAILLLHDFEVGAFAGVIEVEKSSIECVNVCLQRVMTNGVPTETQLVNSALEKQIEKYDEFLPDALLSEGYGQRTFNSKGTLLWLENNLYTV